MNKHVLNNEWMKSFGRLCDLDMNDLMRPRMNDSLSAERHVWKFSGVIEEYSRSIDGTLQISVVRVAEEKYLWRSFYKDQRSNKSIDQKIP